MGSVASTALQGAKTLIEDVSKLRLEGKRSDDELIKSKMDMLKQMMDVAEDQWVKEYDDKNFDDMISKLKSDLQNLETLADGGPTISPSEILERASAGSALRGILVSNNFSDDCVKRIVLSTPTDVTMREPVMTQVDDVAHFSSKEQHDHFHRSLDKMGYRFALDLNAEVWGFQLGAGKPKMENKKNEQHNQTHFESRVKYSVVPTAACELNPESLQLSQEALEKLKDIDRLLVGTNSEEIVHRKCEEFLKSFGSHVSTGLLHFGGISKFVATYTSEDEPGSCNTTCMVQDALNNYASVECAGLGLTVDVPNTADQMTTLDNFTANYDKSEQAKITLSATRNGGPQEVAALSLWKKGLVTCNSTWALIDRGNTLSNDLVGIWDLIPHHKSEFKSLDKVKSSLIRVWEKMSGYTVRNYHEHDEQIIKALDDVDLILGEISNWTSDPKLLERCNEYLHQMVIVTEQLEAQTGTKKYWVDKLCTEEDISIFLMKIVTLKENVDAKDVTMERFLMRRLITPVGYREFPDKQKIMEWAQGIEETETDAVPSFLDGIHAKNIPNLKEIVQEKLIPQLQTIHEENAAENLSSIQLNTQATFELSLCIGKLMKDLESSKEMHKLCFLKIALLFLPYHWPTMTSDTLLTVENLQQFVSFIEMYWKKYLWLEEKGIIQLESFLIHTLLTSEHLDKEMESSEEMFTVIIKDLRQVVSSQLNTVLNKFVTCSPFNWSEMIRITGELAKGNMSVIAEKPQDIRNILEALAFENRQESEPDTLKPSEPAVAGICSKILKTLGLDEYYPSKISLVNAMTIKKKPEQPQLTDVPWMMIQKLLMADFRVRDDIGKVLEKTDEGEASDDEEIYGDDEDIETPGSSDVDDEVGLINTLDAMVAMFTCCDNFLKQTLAQKMFVCKLAIPFLYPQGSDGNILMSLWALRTIIVQSHTNDGETIETPVTEKKFPLVTFVRLGRPPMSKSKLINDILTDGKHNTFFTHDCHNGTVPRRLTEGLVECTWFDTADRKVGHLPGTTMFANLRGDASSMDTQIQILQEISSVIFIVVTAEDLQTPSHTLTCQQILKSGAEVILLIIGKNSKAEQCSCQRAVGKDLMKKANIIPSSKKGGVQKNASELKTHARQKLCAVVDEYSSDMLKECNALVKGLEKCVAIAKKLEECGTLATEVTECIVIAKNLEEYGAMEVNQYVAIAEKLEEGSVLAKKFGEGDALASKHEEYAAELSKKLEECSTLTKKLEKCAAFAKKLENCATLAKKSGINIDEYSDKICLEGKEIAKEVLSHIGDVNILDCKRLLLQLQGSNWAEYCDLLRKQRRTNRKGLHSPLAHQADQAKLKMDNLRKKQVDICQKDLSPFIKSFMVNLQKAPCLVLYILKWLNLSLDQISRKQIPSLQKEHHQKWSMFQTAKKGQKNLEDFKSQVDDAENRLVSASLGLENLFREIGQIYEAVTGYSSIGKDTRNLIEYLPEKAAKLLVEGIPLEIIDGDASSVPLQWMEAVFRQLGRIIGEKKVFVLSVLGIQSSGKSTLLNTMFGMQFAVSAGRCTRGAYIQLIPVDDSAELPFDYILVVDTEGLRAPELGQQKYYHDNELATLVIGLGDVTLVNIKGENTSEMKDILQIAVHAFLRMNLVRNHMKTKRTCIFVHQNVPAANAERLMKRGCQKLLDDLDEMTKEAAHSENQADIDSFTQIINFDVNEHVCYFSDLWHGNPPMAPANPGYSQKAEELRIRLLKIAKEQKTFLTPVDLSTRLTDLWNGVLADDFVFSFRNTLEVKAYNSMQSRYYALEWDLLGELKKWLHSAESQLKRCDTNRSLENAFDSLFEELPDVQRKKAEEIEGLLKDYFKNNNFQDRTIQWEQSKLIQLSFAVEKQQTELRKNLLSIKKACSFEISQNENLSKHKEHIMKKAVELADKLKGTMVSDDDLQVKFNTLWVSMVRKLDIEGADTELQMDVEMKKILLELFQAHGVILAKELESHPLNYPIKHAFLEGSITMDDVKNEHISRKVNWCGRSQGRMDFARLETLKLTKDILKDISTILKDLSKHNMKFQTADATEVILKLKDKFDTYNNNAKEFKHYTFMIRPEYIVKVAVHVSRYCTQVFSVMQTEYNKKHGVKAKLIAYKNMTWSLFKNTVKQATEDVLAGDLLCEHLKGVIKEAVRAKIPQKCMDEVLCDFQMTKYYLIVKMMDDLACKAVFEDFMSYIKQPKEFALRWITQYTNEKMFSCQHECHMSRYAQIAKSHIVRIVCCVIKSVQYATNTVKANMEMALWIDKFSKRIEEEIAVPVSALKEVSDRKVKDFTNLQRIILDQLDDVKTSLENEFAKESKDSVEWDGTPPAQQILDRIWGCPEQYPFCGESCADTTENHFSSSGRSHMCTQHRPPGVRGVRWVDDYDLADGVKVQKSQLDHECCNYAVQKKGGFRCGVCHFKCRDSGKCSTEGTNWVSHDYIEYNTYFPDWDIAPDPTNNVTKYWMWFMVTYQRQLADDHKAKLPYIPESWKSITKEEALADLRKIHF